MKRYNFSDVLAFANTTAGKFFTVAIAIWLALALAGAASAVDGAVQKVTLGGNNTSGTAVTTGSDESNENGSGSTGGTVKVNEAYITLETENCMISYMQESFEEPQKIKVNLGQDLQFAVTPYGNGEGKYVVKSVTMRNGEDSTEAEELSPASDGLYTVPGEKVTSTLVISAKAVMPAPTITLNDMTIQYCAMSVPQYPRDLDYTIDESKLREGDVLVVSDFTGSGRDVGKYELAITDYWIRGDRPVVDEETGEVVMAEQDVTDEYEPVDLPAATLTITKADLYIATPSAEKIYDGEALTYEGDEVYAAENTEELIAKTKAGTYYGPTVLYTLWNEDTNSLGITLKTTGSQTNVGKSNNTVEISPASALDKLLKNYNLHYLTPGILEVKAPKDTISITAPTATKTYTGRAQSVAASDITWGGLPEGFSVKAQIEGGTRTDAGKQTTNIKKGSVKIYDASGKDVTANYKNSKITYGTGELYIEPASLNIITFDAQQQANGQPLTAGGELIGLVNGETATLKLTGAQTAVGSSKNAYTIVWDGTAKSSNYRITQVDMGTLTVTAAPSASNSSGSAAGSSSRGTNTGTGAAAAGSAGRAATPRNTAGGASASPSSADPNATPEAPENEDEDKEGLNSTVETVAQGMQNFEQVIRGEEPTPLVAPAAEETLADDGTPLGVFDAPVDCWVHWYSILGLVATAVYGGVVMFFRRAYAYELESREADILGVPVGIARPHVPAGSGSQVGREA